MTDQELIKGLRSGRNSWYDDDAAADRIEALLEEVEYWKADSAAAWDKCEERRLEAEVKLLELQTSLPSWEEWQALLSAGYEMKIRAEVAEQLYQHSVARIQALINMEK